MPIASALGREFPPVSLSLCECPGSLHTSVCVPSHLTFGCSLASSVWVSNPLHHESSLVQQDFNCLGVWLFQIVCSYLDTYIDCQCTSTYVKHIKIHGIRNVDTCICIDTGVHALGRYVYTYICVYICRQ